MAVMKATGYKSMRMAIEGMHCANCAAAIERKFRETPGVQEVAVNLANNTGKVMYDAAVTDEAALIALFDDMSYDGEIIAEGAPLVDEARRQKERARSRRDVVVFAVAAALTLTMLAISMLPGAHMAVGQLIAGADASHAQAMFATNVLLLILCIPVQFACGARFYSGAVSSLKLKMANMDVLVALGTTITFLFSCVIAFLPVITGDWSHEMVTSINAGMPYFETCGMLITFVLLGKILEARAKKATNQAIEALMNLVPDTAMVRRDGQEVELEVAQVVAGDEVAIHPGERVPVDGIVIEGTTEIDESMLTGEPNPVFKEPGATVTGGTQNATGFIVVRATTVGADSTLSRIVRAVEDAQGSKAPIQRKADKVASIFVPAILGIALLTFLGWMTAGHFGLLGEITIVDALTRALLASIAVVVVACPCALGLATPTALMVGMGKGAQLGVLIKDGAVLEQLCQMGAVVFDKTGTLTRGTPKVVECTVPDEYLPAVAALEYRSEHPVAHAIIDYISERYDGTYPTGIKEFEAIPGKGVQGIIRKKLYQVGSRVLVDGEDVGAFIVRDEPRDDAAAAVAGLRKTFGIDSYMVTGDNAEAAGEVAQAIGIAPEHVRAGVLPLQKADAVSSILAEVKAGAEKDNAGVAFVGDGINDAPALAAADVGIVMGSGTDIAMEAGGVVLMHNRPSDVVTALRLSKATVRKIRQNLFWALIYNVIMIPLAIFGILAPELAGAAMACSSVFVVCNSLLLKRFK